MFRRFGNLTIATKGIAVAAYYNHSPSRTTFAGFTPRNGATVGRSVTPGVKAFGFGPFVIGRYDFAWIGRR